MKKLISLTIIILLCLSLISCEKGTPALSPSSSGPPSNNAQSNAKAEVSKMDLNKEPAQILVQAAKRLDSVDSYTISEITDFNAPNQKFLSTIVIYHNINKREALIHDKNQVENNLTLDREVYIHIVNKRTTGYIGNSQGKWNNPFEMPLERPLEKKAIFNFDKMKDLKNFKDIALTDKGSYVLITAKTSIDSFLEMPQQIVGDIKPTMSPAQIKIIYDFSITIDKASGYATSIQLETKSDVGVSIFKKIELSNLNATENIPTPDSLIKK